MKINSKSISKIFDSNTWSIIGFLLVFIILSLAISLRFPSYTEGFQEGLLSDSEKTSIQKALDDYTKAVETICDTGVKDLSKVTTLSKGDSVQLTPLIGDDATTNTAKIDKVSELKSANEDINKIIMNVNGQKYLAILTMLNTLNKTTYTDDQTFAELLKNQTGAAKNVITGDDSVYSQIKSYLKTISQVGKSGK